MKCLNNWNNGFPFLLLEKYHDCHEGVVTPGTYKNIPGEIMKIDPKTSKTFYSDFKAGKLLKPKLHRQDKGKHV